MKKRFCFLLMALLLLSACGKEEPPMPTPVPETLPTEEPAPVETTLTGSVYEQTGASLVLQSDDGGLYAFALPDGVELVPGQRLTLRMAGAPDAETLWQTAEILEIESEPLPEENGIHTFRGIIQEATMYTLTLRGEDGALYTFPMDPARCFAPGGIRLGFTAEVDCAEPPNPENAWQMVTVLAMRVLPTETPGGEKMAREEAVRRAAELLAGMTLEERVGQVFLGRFPLQNAAESAARHHLGGYVLYAENVAGKSPAVLQAEIEAVQAAAATPLLIAVDEEGGSVNRLSVYTAFRAAPFLSPMSLYHQGGWLSVQKDTAEKSALLRSVGVNVNLAPVADVSRPGTYMYPRSFGADAALTAQYVDEVVRGYEAAGMGCVLKHFPGYGDNGDTHAGTARDERSLDELMARDMLPFTAGIEAGAGCVLLSHNVVTALDPGLPASLSPAVYAFLRDTLGFEGVAMTDDLAMSAIRAYADSGEAAVQALRSGCDLICSAFFEREIAAVMAAVQTGTLSQARLNEAAQRVLIWKLQLGLME